MRTQTGVSVLVVLVVLVLTAAALVGVNEYLKKQRQENAVAAIAAEEDAHLARVYGACHSAVKALAKFSSKVAFIKTSHVEAEDGSENLTVIGNADLMNDAGAMIPHNFMCQVNPATYTLTEEAFIMVEGSTPDDLLREVLRESRR